MDRMSEAEVKEGLRTLPEWSESAGAINRTFQFKDFVEAMKFVNAVAMAAEADAHHPDILVRWNKVTLSLSTHDASGITCRDFALAAKVDGLARSTSSGGGKPAPVKPVRR
jgi:4a-hydroxytetrahydrobiopterin dehydratase